MTTLNCCSTNCVNNKHGTCKAHEINVNGQGAHFSSDTECNGFNNSKLRSTLNKRVVHLEMNMENEITMETK